MNRIFWLFTVILGVSLAIIIPSFAPGRGEQDFIRYWAASRLLITGGNPYDGKELSDLQIKTRPDLAIKEGDIVEAWNPPWLLLTLLPIGLMPFNLAVPIWVFLNVLLIVIALAMSWRFSGGDNNHRLFLIVLGSGVLFGNTIILIRLGQISTLILISLLVGFWLIQKDRDWLAGIIFLVATIKPHLTYLILFVLLIWSLQHHRWKILVSMVITAFFSAFLIWLVLPDWLSIYFQTILRLPFTNIYTSTLGSFSSEVLNLPILKFVPFFLLPLAFPLAKNMDKIGWFTTMNLTLVISIPLSIYGFSFDQVLLLPAIVQMIAWITQGLFSSKLAWGIAFGLILTYVILLWMMSLKDLPYYWFFWISFLIMWLYLVSWRYQNGTIEVV
jgi:hypothetical protein